MRPRHDAAENDVRDEPVVDRLTGASMRPRHDAAENSHTDRERFPESDASMRPRHDAAENGPARNPFALENLRSPLREVRIGRSIFQAATPP